jgi:cytochrome c556
MAVDETGLIGTATEVGFFDPLNLSKGKDEATLKWYRAVELKHGRVAMLASMIPEVTAADTSGPASAGIKTRASNTIWTSKADFDKLAADLGAGAAAALEILNTKGEAGVKDAVAAIGPKCGACHDRFRMD